MVLDPQRYVRDAPAVDNASEQIAAGLARLAAIKAQNPICTAAGAPVLGAVKTSTPTPVVNNITIGGTSYRVTTDQASASSLLSALEASFRAGGGALP